MTRICVKAEAKVEKKSPVTEAWPGRGQGGRGGGGDVVLFFKCFPGNNLIRIGIIFSLASEFPRTVGTCSGPGSVF